MSFDIYDLVDHLSPWPLVALAVFLRVGACVFFLPVFGEVAVSVRIKLVASLAFTVLVVPLVGPSQMPEQLAARLFVSEALAGLMLGFALRLMVIALRTAGSIAAQSTSLAQLLGGAGVEPQPAISAMLTFAALALAASMNLHVHVVAMFASSFEVLPMGLFPLGLDVADWAVEHVAACFALAFSLSLPFVGGALLYNLALGVINRAMPQMMVAFVGAPAITLGTLAMMVLAVPVILSVWLALFEARLASPLGLAE